MAGTVPPRQLPLELGHAPGFSRDDLVVSPANAAAVALVDRWPDWAAPLAILAGPTGSGKSHLAAIWRDAAGAQALDPARLGGASFSGRPLLVDAIEPGRFDETALFHLVNAVREAGSTMLVTSRRFPSAWGARLPDLASRLRAATLVELAEPDDLLLAGVLTKLFSDRQVAVESHVVRYIASRIERSLATACRVVEKLDRAALEGKTRISRALAAEVIGAIDAGQGEFDL